MDQLICASLSHTHYLYEVGMLKVPAVMKGEQVEHCGIASIEILYIQIETYFSGFEPKF